MKQQTKGGALHRLWQALPWLWMVAAYLFDLWYQLVPGKWIVDSDLASEMILSDLLNKECSIISRLSRTRPTRATRITLSWNPPTGTAATARNRIISAI